MLSNPRLDPSALNAEIESVPPSPASVPAALTETSVVVRVVRSRT
jgi:hypothetical protein